MSEQDLRASLTALAHSERGEHPSPEMLLEYHLGELPTASEEALQDHLAQCPACSRALLDFATFPEVEPAPATAPATAADIEALWSGVRSALPRKTPFFATAHFARAAALFFLASTLALGGALVRQPASTPPAPSPSTPASTSPSTSPRLNLPIFELHAVDSRSTRDDLAETTPPLTAHAEGAVIVLVVAETEPFAHYEARIESAQGEELWSTRTLVRTPQGLLSLYLPRDFLPAGHYTIHLSGLGATSPVPLARFELHLAHR